MNKSETRSPNDDLTTTTSQVQITQLRDTGVKTDQVNVVNPSAILKSVANPYPDQTPVDILSRMYLVGNFIWSSGIPVLNTMDFPYALLQIPQITERLRAFRWMRAGIRLQVKINSTQFHYGAYMISYIQNHKGLKHATTLYQQSGNRPLVLSAAMQNSCDFTINWMNPYNFFEVTNGTSEIARVFFQPITPLGVANPNVTDVVRIQVYASFTQPECAGYQMQSGVVAEAKKKSKFQLADGSDLVTSIFEKIPIIGGIVNDFTRVISALDKPASLMATNPIELSFSREMSKGVGLDTAQSLSLMSLAPVDLTRQLMGEEDDKMNLLKIAQVPMLHHLHKFQGINDTTTFAVTPYAGNLDYFQFIARHFSYWRGSIKYKFCFYTSNFTSCRFRISVVFNNVAPTEETAGDITSSIVDVRGDTVYDVTIPYLWPTLYRPFRIEVAKPLIYVQQIIPIIGPSFEEDPVIQMVVWRSAGEDVRFNQLVTYYNYLEQPLAPLALKVAEPVQLPEKEPVQEKVFDMQMDPQACFKKTFEPIALSSCFIREQGTISGEHIESLHDIIKRYVTGYSLLNNKLITYPNPTQLGAYHTMSAIFKYWRGSRRVKTITKVDAGGVAYHVMENPTDSYNAGNGMAFTLPNTWPTLSTEIPWYSSLPFLPVRPLSVPVYSVTDNPRDPLLEPVDVFTNGAIFLSAGDDFLYGLLIAPDFSSLEDNEV